MQIDVALTLLNILPKKLAGISPRFVKKNTNFPVEFSVKI